MKSKSILLLLVLFTINATAQNSEKVNKWKLIMKDDFKGSTLDNKKWSKIPRGGADWNRYTSDNEACYKIENGTLILRGINNSVEPSDTARYLTGGVYTKGKVSIQYGKVEICARLGSAQGAWPAMWMLTDKPKYGEYPKNGEIDIMEHLNYDTIIYQTVHSDYTLNLGGRDNPKNYSTVGINPNVYNIFGVELYPDKLVFTLNGKVTFTYPRIDTDKEGQFPFDQPYYLMIDQQLGGSWVGKVAPETLPVDIEIDWVKMYIAK